MTSNRSIWPPPSSASQPAAGGPPIKAWSYSKGHPAEGDFFLVTVAWWGSVHGFLEVPKNPFRLSIKIDWIQMNDNQCFEVGSQIKKSQSCQCWLDSGEGIKMTKAIKILKITPKQLHWIVKEPFMVTLLALILLKWILKKKQWCLQVYIFDSDITSETTETMLVLSVQVLKHPSLKITSCATLNDGHRPLQAIPKKVRPRFETDFIWKPSANCQ